MPVTPLIPTAYNTVSSYAIYLKKGGKGNYASFLKSQALGEIGKSGCTSCGGGHESHEDCGCEEGCSCCKPGLVAVFDDKGNNLGCLTPSDAELFTINTYECADGYVKLINATTGQFLGCVTEANFGALYTQINP